MKTLVILGAPGAGKGTQAELICAKYGIAHISVGDILRDNVKNGTELGKLANAYMQKGQLVPDSIIIDLIKNRLSESDCNSGYLLDGFPRTIEQAKALDEIVSLPHVINIKSDEEIIVKRISGRRVCKACNGVFHIKNLHTDDCPKCGGELIQRKDDTIDIIKSRLDVYKKQTAPLVEYYDKKDILVNVDGDREPLDIFKDIQEILKWQ